MRENLLLGMKSARQHGTMVARRPVSRSFPLLRERIDAPGGVLSGGEQQMLTICRTLMGDPELIMVDEPTEGLCAADGRAACAGCSRRSPGAAIAILLIEQKLTIALAISRRLYVMGQGRIVFEGTRGAVARQSRGAQASGSKCDPPGQRFASRIMLRAMTSRWISLVPS